MLHVFYLDAGRMLTYDVNYAAEPVSSLQEAIYSSSGAPLVEQILLISGGEVLDPSKKVSTYSAGMDSSNPIFLVCRTDPSTQNTKGAANFVESQATKDLESLLLKQQPSLLASIQTIQMNLQLAKKFAAACDEDFARCSQYVNDQHLIHQGWCAVIANLDDTTNAFRQRICRYRERHDKFLLQKNKAGDLLKNFTQDITLLKRIPLLNCLLAVATASSSPPQAQNVSAAIGDGHQTTSSSTSSITLFDWISSKEPESSLNELADDTRKTLEQILDSKIIENLSHWETVTLERVRDSQMKEIKGLGRRLDQLNEYFEHVKKIRSEQHQYVEIIAHQEQQALTTRDVSILSQLCISQTDVLKVLLANQKRLSDISRRFFEAKNELLTNIRVRLQWVADTHQIIHTADNKVLLNGERLRKIRRQLELLRQLHDAPVIYASAVGEVLRRKSFSREFLEWSERLVSKSRALHADENRLRDLFSEKLDRHFLRSLFRGMDDKASNFCIEPPEPFDVDLPPVDIHHVREIRQSVPQLASILQVCQPQVYERMSLNDWKSAEIRRDVSFFSQTPPKYSQLAFNRSCQSPSWMSGDEFSPNTVGVLFQATASDASGAEDGDNQDNQNCGLAFSSTTPRSAPIKIPSRAPSDIMTTSRQFSEKSSRFGTPDEGASLDVDVVGGGSAPMPNDRKISSSNLREIAQMTQSMIGRVCQMNDVLPLGELAMERSALMPDILNRSSSDHHSSAAQQRLSKLQNDLDEKIKLLNESVQRETVLETRLKECEEKLRTIDVIRRESGSSLKKDYTKLCDDVHLMSSTFRQTFDDIRSSLSTFAQSTRESTDKSTTILFESAKKLERNLQNSLAEAEKATSAVKQDEFERHMNELRDELDKERQQFRDLKKQMENVDAYLKQKDEVIEILQQNMNENELQNVRKCEDAKSEIIKQLTIEQELEMEALRRDFQTQLDMKDNENRHLLNELREKDLVIKQMRREQDKLVASVYEREMNGIDENTSDALNVELKRMKDDEFDDRLKQIKHDLEQGYKDKLQMLTAGLEQKQNQQIERLRVEKEVELRMLKEQHHQELNKFVALSSSPPVVVPPLLTTASTTMLLNAVEESYYAVVDLEERRTSDVAENLTVVQQDVDYAAATASKFETDDGETVATPESAAGDVSIMQQSECSPIKSSTTMETFSSANSKNLRTINTQTRPDYRISVLRLQAGDLILLVFDQKIGSYVAFSVSATLYVLKETSAQRMGLIKPKAATSTAGVAATALEQATSNADSTTKWVFARLLESDFCQIKKPSNRYSLPLGTKFYRVSAERCEIVPKEDVKRSLK